MKNVGVVFEPFDGDENDMKGHMIFDVKMARTFGGKPVWWLVVT